MNRWKLPALLAVAGLVSGCASTPDVTLTHFAPRAELSVTVTRSVRCTSDQQDLLVTHVVTPVAAYQADRNRPLPLDISALRSAWANTELTVTWRDDGRLQSINSTAVGQGNAIVTAALSTVGKVVGRMELLRHRGGKPPAAPSHPACAVVKQLLTSDDKILTLHYTSATVDGLSAATLGLSPAADSAALHNPLRTWLPEMQLSVAPRSGGPAPVQQPEGANADAARLRLPVPVSTRLALSIDGQEAWSSEVMVPGATTYDIPIPRARPFGKHVFAVVLSEAGALTTLTYNTESGVAGAVQAVGDAAGAGKVARDARTEALKAEADYLAAQARLASCLAKPDDCK